ncbi:Regulator of G protein signaling domain containing protein [Ceratobasidium theobromae]|uniref:Regulator of G protein signaling domain containing protein n=1 Tax=Ceratobasidium theobromae TaxID=1582974 RepID=A0A5N5QQZ4_9AGAM|nr:Regulator of G protein signaling domain containing protein [Ceratobasidium theobromae]
MYAAKLSRWAGRRATRKLVNQIRLVNILSGDACSPLGLEEFEAYLEFQSQEHSLENLQFIVWYHDYRARFFALSEEEQAYSPAPTRTRLGSPSSTHAPTLPSSARSSWTPWSPRSVPTSPIPPKNQPFRTETLQIIATFIRPKAKKELSLDADVRDELLHNLERSTHPDVFAPAYARVYDLVDTCSVPNFVSTAAPNINLPKQIYWYAIGIVFTLVSWAIAVCTIYFVPDDPRSRRSIRLVSVPFAVAGCMQIYSAWRGFCSQVFGRSARQLHAWELVDPADAGVSFDVPSPPPPVAKPRGVLDMVAGTNRYDVAPFLSLASTDSDTIEMGPVGISASRDEPRISSAEDAHPGRPPVYGPERVVDDPRVRAYHRAVLRDMLWVGFAWGVAWTAIIVGVPGR